MINSIEKCIVIMGALNEVGHFSTHGTGVLISLKDKAYAVTCRHVAMDMCRFEVKFVIPNPKRTLTIPTALLLSEPIYYNLNEPYVDMCLMEISEYSASILNANGVNTINMESLDEITNAVAEDELVAYGYPGDITSKYLSENRPTISIPIMTIHSTATNWYITEDCVIPQNTENKVLYDSRSSQLTYTKNDILNIEGISGGPVLQKETGRLCGIATAGQINAQLSNNKSRNILFVTPASYLIDMLNRLL